MPTAPPDKDPLFGNPASDLLRGAMEDAPGTTPTAAWEPPTSEQLAALLPQYEIECMLGRGGMGAVYKGRQIALERPVAVKILSNHLAGTDTSFAERFKNEARAMAKLSHSGIVTVYDFGEAAGGLLYIVMEFVEGTDVGAMIVQQGRLHSEHAMAITAHVCDALAYAHGLGIIHRDIKPANIMLRNDGVVKVADFGLAKFSSEDGKTQGLTQGGMAIGTPHFVAPEALMHGLTLDHRADIYAVGVMLYQMLTGKLPQGLFELPSLQIPGLDPRYDAIIGKALRENREVRYPSVQDLRRDLDAILTQPVAKLQANVEEAPAALTPRARSKRASNPPVRHDRPAQPPKSTLRGTFAWGLLFVLLGATAVYFFGGVQKETGSSSASPVPSEEWRDLLAVVDPETGTVSGRWTRVAEGLHGERLPDGKGAQVLQLPYEPPEEYDFRVAYTTLEGNAEISQILSASGRQFTWGTASGQPEKWAGFNMIKGKPMMLNGAGVKLPVRRELNRRYESLVEVRRDRVTGYVDGKKLVEWRTDYSDLSMDPAHVVPNSRALGIGIWWSKTVFHEISVREVAGKGTRLSPPSAVATGSSPPLGDPAKTTKGQPFVNSLGMKFVPVPGTNTLFCIHETRKADYAAFAAATPGLTNFWWNTIYQDMPVSFADDHPVCNISWQECRDFCQWLSRKEGRTYRLPTDREWSFAVGIGDREDATVSPHLLSDRLKGEFPWGRQWPPPAGVGNLGDSVMAVKFPKRRVIPGYTDGFATTAPVMSFSPNPFGLYDLCGNVWEFCEDWYDETQTTHVIRGLNFDDGGESSVRFLSSHRGWCPAPNRHANHGFRIVLER